MTLPGGCRPSSDWFTWLQPPCTASPPLLTPPDRSSERPDVCPSGLRRRLVSPPPSPPRAGLNGPAGHSDRRRHQRRQQWRPRLQQGLPVRGYRLPGAPHTPPTRVTRAPLHPLSLPSARPLYPTNPILLNRQRHRPRRAGGWETHRRTGSMIRPTLPAAQDSGGKETCHSGSPTPRPLHALRQRRL